MDDPFGQAIQEFLSKGKAPDIKVNTNYTENEAIPVSYLFRPEKKMPELEKLALRECKGKILDIGAAAGCHSIVLQEKGFQVTALEKSKLAVEAMRKRSIEKVVNSDIFDFKGKQFDTIILLMNGAGMGGSLAGLKTLLAHLKTLLHPEGQILMDSSDIKYLFEEEDGSMWIDLSSNRYYGEMEYQVTFRKWSDKFNWLFVDFKRLEKVANEVGLSCNRLANGPHYAYLAQLKPKA